MSNLPRLSALLLTLCALMSACAGAAPGPESTLTPTQVWQPADLRLLDPVDSPSPAQDLIAAYLRLSKTDLQIRLDLLGNEDPLGYDLHIALDFLPGRGKELPFDSGNAFGWDVILTASANQDPRMIVRDGLFLARVFLPRVVRDSFLDCAVLSIPSQLFSGSRQISAWAWISSPDTEEVLDTLGPFQLEGAVPARAPVLLEFWNTLPARTPAQLLRRWDGAHTGPYGQRHGLVYLLKAAQTHRVPITLLDLAQPQSLRGLTQVGGLDLVRQMANSGLLSLPDNGYASPAFSTENAAFYRKIAAGFALPVGKASYGYTQNGGIRQPDLVYAALQDAGHIAFFDGVRFVPARFSMGSQSSETIGRDGLTRAALRKLLDIALSQDPADLAVLGGSLPESAWGDLTVADQAMQYIAGHPWIHPLSTSDLVVFPTLEKQGLYEVFTCPEDSLCSGSTTPVAVLTPYGMPAANPIESTELTRLIFQSLSRLPSDPFANAARGMVSALTQPAVNSHLAQLNASALGQVGFLIEASRWNQQPSAQAGCNLDLDWDGYPECVLSDLDFFSVLDPEGGRLAFAAVRRGAQAVQWMGPTFETAGLSAETGNSDTLANSSEVIGAFADPGSDWAVYTATPEDNRITLRDDRRGITRIFSLSDGTLEIRLENDPTPHRLPIFLSWLPGAGDLDAGDTVVRWPLSSDFNAELKVQGAAIIDHAGVTDALPLLRQSEDPDRAYPAGHYLPFPFLILEFDAEKDLTLTISVK
ncbi:hypothetical protein LARV_02311 [Longilinea arvoryzae]|uniref:Uncharacterized protein n=1 Tax=Longilinea arvoryzae TaxID=360412 RepID=A0A0S7BKQ7_9CHLR|nr:hypothetical protein [Longilinea arvoryzae]GAP14539.1 hypothetical protein LARV_02311 [Longilinea arvoryzae]